MKNVSVGVLRPSKQSILVCVVDVSDYPPAQDALPDEASIFPLLTGAPRIGVRSS